MKWLLVILAFAIGVGIGKVEDERLTDEDFSAVCGAIWAAGAYEDDGSSKSREAIRQVCNL